MLILGDRAWPTYGVTSWSESMRRGNTVHFETIADKCSGHESKTSLFAEVHTIGVWPRHRQSWPRGAGPHHVQREERGQKMHRGGWDSLYLHLLQLYRCLALPRQHSPCGRSPTFGSLQNLWWWHRERYFFSAFCFLACREIILVTFFFSVGENIYITPHIP